MNELTVAVVTIGFGIHLISRQEFPKNSKLMKINIHHVNERPDFETMTLIAFTDQVVIFIYI